MDERERELKELCDSMQVRHSNGNVSNLTPREKELLAKYTVYPKLGTGHKSVFAIALASGATLDAEGRLIINHPEARQQCTLIKRARYLHSKPELISPLTENLGFLFKSLPKHLGKKSTDWRGPTVYSQRGEKQRFGRWPGGRRRP